MLGESRDILGQDDVCVGKDEDLTAVRGRNAATAGVSGANFFVPNDCPYGQLDTELS